MVLIAADAVKTVPIELNVNDPQLSLTSLLWPVWLWSIFFRGLVVLI